MGEDLLEKRHRVLKIINILREATKGMERPASLQIVERFGRNPYLILISCLLSLRTRDTVSLPASLRLFTKAHDPFTMLRLSTGDIENLIYPVGFYRNKARLLQAVSRELIDRFKGEVPANKQDLLSIKGIGLKTAHLVLGEAFGIPALCVDTHVHRISNRLGLVVTKRPEETELALQHIVPRDYWVEFSKLLVTWGQNVCLPVLPKCSQCPIAVLCPKVGVKSSR